MGIWLWPVIDDEASAREVCHLAATCAAILAMVTLLAVMLSAALDRDFRFVILILPAFWALCAWRIWNGSRAWAIAAFTVYLPLAILTVMSLSLLWSIVLPFAFMGLVHGLRATRALQKFADQRLMAELRG